MGWKLAIGAFVLAFTLFAEEAPRLKTLEKGNFSGIQEPLQLVVTNKAQWDELWAKHTAQKIPKTPAPEINFSKHSVLFVAAGRKNTGGYSVEITDVRRIGDKTEVLVTSKEPKRVDSTFRRLPRLSTSWKCPELTEK